MIESFNLTETIKPNTSTKTLRERSILQASAGKMVVVGFPEFFFWYCDKRSQWAVKQPHVAYPDFFDSTDEAVDFFLQSWFRGK